MNAPRPTHLRDARLRHALEHAPDAQAAPAEATRAAILRHAHAAVATPAPAPPPPWWTRLAQALAGPRRPWNAGFATVLLACVVAGLWWERDVPGPAPDAQHPAPAMPAPATREAPERKESTAPAGQPGAGAVPQAQEKAQPAPRAARPQPAPALPRAEPAAPPAPSVSVPPPAEAPLRARAPSPRAEVDDAQSASAPPAGQDPAGTAASRASRALGAGPSRPAAAPAPTLARPAPAATLDAFAWTAVQRQSAPARARASLPADVRQAIDDLLRTGATAVPADDPVLAHITLLHEGGAVLGQLELGAYSMRWAPAGDRLPRAFAARVEPATSQRIRDALAQ